MRTTLILMSILTLAACSKKSTPEPAAKKAATEAATEAAAEETSETTTTERVVKPVVDEGTTVKPVVDAEGEDATPMTAERGSCLAIAERVVELAMQKEEEPAFRKKDIEALTEACKANQDAEAKSSFAECIDGATDLAAARDACKVITTAKGWME